MMLMPSVLLGYGENQQAYFIRCQDCQERFAEYPEEWKLWEKEMQETERKLQSLMDSESNL
jgi:SWI/SNF-related matrix-associated actin-dependent regulator of chromatin subfamily A member 5